MKTNKIGALVHAPELIQGLLNIRENRAQIQGETLFHEQCDKKRRNIARLGGASSWLFDLDGEYN